MQIITVKPAYLREILLLNQAAIPHVNEVDQEFFHQQLEASLYFRAILLEGSVKAWRGFVDQIADDASLIEKDAMRQAFLTSSRYEYMFWDAAHNRQQWPV